MARWGYSTSVAIWEYFNEINPNLPAGKFYTKLGEYLEQIDPYNHLRTTSAWALCEANWIHPKLDTADLHWYLRPAWGEIWKDEVAGVVDRAKLLRRSAINKPALLSEFGLANDKWMLSPYMKQDKELVHFHNIMWVSALSGLSGSTAFWWWEQLDMQDAYHHYKPLSAFVADIPFTTANLHEISTTASDQHLRVIGLQGKDSAYVWLFNYQTTWWNTVVENIIPAIITNAKFHVKNLSSGTYRVQWWNTWEGKILKQEAIQTSDGRLEILIPDFASNIACKIAKK